MTRKDISAKRYLRRLVSWVKPDDRGSSYSSYFKDLNDTLKESGPSRPSLLIDLDCLDRNITTLRSSLGYQKPYRLVAKSLPSLPLLDYIMKKTGTDKLMVFHQPFLNRIAEAFPQADILLGKPLPVRSAACFYSTCSSSSEFDPSRQLQWLIDTDERLTQYQRLAHQIGAKLRVNIEIDIGLHRGGLKAPVDLVRLLEKIISDPEHLSFSGLMGYDPHVVKVPGLIKTEKTAFNESQASYRAFLKAINRRFPQIDSESLCLNGAGSPTLDLHRAGSVANDLAAGSCLVKPTDFDIPSLHRYVPAAYIAAPVLKKMKDTEIPAAERFKRFFSWWDPNQARTYFLYGGKWMAQYESPAGLQNNRLYGSSTNQQMVNGSKKTNLAVDDHIFLRPTQSEFVFLQFGDILAIRNGMIVDSWPVLKQ